MKKKYGQGSQYFTGTQIFWKDKYYITITANDENEEIIRSIQILSKQIDNKIISKGEIPNILDSLPDEDLQKNGFIYFHHYIWLNSYYFIADENFLNINDHTDAVIAKYGDKNNRKYLLLVNYPNNMEAETAYRAFKNKFFQSDTMLVKLEDDTWIGASYKNNILLCVFNSRNEKDLQNLLDKTIQKIK